MAEPVSRLTRLGLTALPTRARLDLSPGTGTGTGTAPGTATPTYTGLRATGGKLVNKGGKLSCECCCDTCLNYSETFTATSAPTGWTTTGTVTWPGGAAALWADASAASGIDNTSVAGKLTGNVKTSVDFILYEETAWIEITVSFSSGADRKYLITETALFVRDDSGGTADVEVAFPDEIVRGDEYTFSFCVNPSNDMIDIGIENLVSYTDPHTNGGLASFEVAGNAACEWVPEIPPSTPGFIDCSGYSGPVSAITEVRQYDRDQNIAGCCPCTTPTGPQLIDCFDCTAATDSYLVSITGAAPGNIDCCTEWNDDYVLDFDGVYNFGNYYGCVYSAFFFCDAQAGYPATPGLACCGEDYDGVYIGGTYTVGISAVLTIVAGTGGNISHATIEFWMYVNYGGFNYRIPVTRLYAETSTFTGTEDCAELVFNVPSVFGGRANCDGSSVAITATAI